MTFAAKPCRLLLLAKAAYGGIQEKRKHLALLVVCLVRQSGSLVVQRMLVGSTNFNCYLKLALARLPALILLATMVISVSAQEQTSAIEAERLMSVAKAAQEQGQYDDAIRAYRQVVVLSKASPKNAALAYYNAGVLYLRFKKYEDAVSAFQQSILHDPSSAEANNNLGEALGALKQYPAAVAAFQRAVALDSNLLIAQFNMGLTYNQMGQPGYAEFVYKVLIRDHPDYALGYDGMAVTLAKSGRARDAIPLHEKAISLSPESPFFYYNLGVSYLVLGNTEKALEQKEKLLQLDPLAANRLATLIAKH